MAKQLLFNSYKSKIEKYDSYMDKIADIINTVDDHLKHITELNEDEITLLKYTLDVSNKLYDKYNDLTCKFQTKVKMLSHQIKIEEETKKSDSKLQQLLKIEEETKKADSKLQQLQQLMTLNSLLMHCMDKPIEKLQVPKINDDNDDQTSDDEQTSEKFSDSENDSDDNSNDIDIKQRLKNNVNPKINDIMEQIDLKVKEIEELEQELNKMYVMEYSCHKPNQSVSLAENPMSYNIRKQIHEKYDEIEDLNENIKQAFLEEDKNKITSCEKETDDSHDSNHFGNYEIFVKNNTTVNSHNNDGLTGLVMATSYVNNKQKTLEKNTENVVEESEKDDIHNGQLLKINCKNDKAPLINFMNNNNKY